MDSIDSSGSLKVHEWLAIAFLIGLLASLTFLTSISNISEPSDNVRVSNKTIEVLINGRVDHPGIYRIPPGMPLKDVLALAKPLPDADLRRFNLNRPVVRGRSLNIRARNLMTVYLKGAVKNPGPISLPKGSKRKDLLEIVEIEDGADATVLNGNRKLKEGEEIEIPSKP